jgi:hypothetical protein
VNDEYVNDEYLWDRSGPPDPEIVALEHLLSPIGTRVTGAPLRLAVLPAGRRRNASRIIFALATAAIVLLAVLPRWLARPFVPGARAWHVVQADGPATISSRTIQQGSTLSVGETLRTARTGQVGIEFGDVGHVDIGPSTEVRLLATRPGHYRLRLNEGTLTAYIWAAPGQFFVETQSSLAVDLGCAYTLQVDDRGVGELRVTTGWVGFKWRDRQALIPAGAMCATRAGEGPGTPHYDDAPAALDAALDALDFGDTAVSERDAALDRVLAAARPRDALTLWHLLQRVDAPERLRVYDRLARFVPPPPQVTRDGIEAGDKRMIDLWWDRLGLGSADFWRAFARPWAEPR